MSQAAFVYWRRRLDELDSSAPVSVGASQSRAPKAAFMPVRVSLGMVEIHLPSGARVLIPGGDSDALRIAIETAARCAPATEAAQ